MGVNKQVNDTQSITQLLQTPQTNSYQDKESANKASSPQQLNNLNQTQFVISNESLKQGAPPIRCPKPTISHFKSPIHSLQQGQNQSFLSVKRSNSKIGFQHEEERSAFKNITNSLSIKHNTLKVNLQFPTDMPLPNPILN